jgi:hypothetical protein
MAKQPPLALIGKFPNKIEEKKKKKIEEEKIIPQPPLVKLSTFFFKLSASLIFCSNWFQNFPALFVNILTCIIQQCPRYHWKMFTNNNPIML